MLISLMPATNLRGVIFFTQVVAKALAAYTNECAWAHIQHDQEYANEQGRWKNIDSREILGLVALIICMNVVNAPRLANCRSTAHLFAHGTSQLFHTLSQNLHSNDTNCLTMD